MTVHYLLTIIILFYTFIVVLIPTELKQKNTSLTLTNKRLCVSYVMLSKRIFDIPLKQINSVEVKPATGTIFINTASDCIHIKHIKEPMDMHKKITQAMHNL